MITLIVAIAACGGVVALSHVVGDVGWGWSIFFGVVAFGTVQGVATFMLQKRVKRDMEAVQRILADGQKKLQAKMDRWKFRPPSSMQAAQREMLDDTKVFVKQALDQTDTLRRYRLWMPMMERQIATAKLQLCWMIKDFKAVDTLLPKAILVDPTLVAMKMARLYMTDATTDEIAKVYAKGSRRVRYNGNVLMAATMSWIQVKRNDVDGAFRTLTAALEKSDDATLKRNHEQLMNNRVAHFTNSGLGDQWYALMLEEPKMHTPRQRSVYR